MVARHDARAWLPTSLAREWTEFSVLEQVTSALELSRQKHFLAILIAAAVAATALAATVATTAVALTHCLQTGLTMDSYFARHGVTCQKSQHTGG